MKPELSGKVESRPVKKSTDEAEWRSQLTLRRRKRPTSARVASFTPQMRGRASKGIRKGEVAWPPNRGDDEGIELRVGIGEEDVAPYLFAELEGKLMEKNRARIFHVVYLWVSPVDVIFRDCWL